MDPEPPSYLLINALPIAISLWGGLLVLILLLLCSAFVSGSEVAFFSLSKKDVEQARNNQKTNWKRIMDLLKNRRELLAVILILNNLINIGIVLLAAALSETYIHPGVEKMGLSLFNIDINTLIDIVFITFLLMLFGEIIPKIYAGKNVYPFASFMSGPLNIASTVLHPISFVLLKLSNGLEKRIKQSNNLTIDELSHALELTSEDKTTTSEEQKMFEGIVNFGKTETQEIMTPRVDMFMLESDMEFKAVVEAVADNGYSRIPVFVDSVDEILGVLYAKDLIPYLGTETYDWTKLLREPFFVPESKKIDDLLAEFKERKIHQALVADEYGGLSGLITLEDVVEEIVGDIADEFDDEELTYSKLDENNFVLEAKTSLKDFYRILDLDEKEIAKFEEEKSEADTLAGFILEIANAFPKKRQVIIFENFRFIIESLDKRRIKQIKVSRNDKEDEPDS